MLKKKIFALVGASANPEKYGYKILKDLTDAGFNVIPINLKEKKILGQKVYAHLSDVKDKIEMVIFVVPPAVTERVLTEVKKLGIKKVWLQPGSESEKAISFCQKNQIEVVHDRCVMVERRLGRKDK
ncbi:MAG: CoA-binding protein [Candidatus Woesebacteria bacterium]|jgi:predicted CoA-binding protein